MIKMKNKVLFVIFMSLIFMVNKVNAASVTISLSCKDALVGNNTTCMVYAAAPEYITSFHCNYKISSNASIIGFSLGTGWSGEWDGGVIDLYTASKYKGNVLLGTFNIRGNNVGTTTLSLSNMTASDENYNDISNISNVSKTFSIVAPTTTQAPTTQAQAQVTTYKPTTARRTEPVTNVYDVPTTITTEPTTHVPLKLNSLIVDDFDVKFENNTYYVTVEANTKEVMIKATADEGISIIGTGKRTLSSGKNSVDLILKDASGNSDSYKLIITKPDGSNIDTRLNSLSVVGYNLKFNADVKEYNVYVPFNLKQVYIEAKTSNKDLIITGAGVNVLKNGNNQIKIKVSYGDIKSTTYIINIKRNYLTFILIGVISFTTIGMIGMYIKSKNKLNKEVSRVRNDANRIIAENNKIEQLKGPNISLNGESSLDVGRRIVVPTKVVDSKPVSNIKTANEIVNASIDNKLPTPEAVKEIKIEPIESVSNVSPTVKVVKKKIVTTPTVIKTKNEEPVNEIQNPNI